MGSGMKYNIPTIIPHKKKNKHARLYRPEHTNN